MSVLDRSALEESPLADLHAIASELSIDGYRRLRRPELIDAILERQGTEPPEPEALTVADDEGAPAVEHEEVEGAEEPAATRRRRGRRGGGTRATRDEETVAEAQAAEEAPEAPIEEAAPAGAVEDIAEGVVELLPNGSGFLRVNPPDPSEDDVYISAAQIKRCELVAGDRISGPRRAPRRSERFASLIRIDSINDLPASEVSDSGRFDDLPAGFATERLRLGSEDPTLKAIEFLTPIGRGSRVSVVGAPQAGKTEALRRVVSALSGQDDLQLLIVLAGVRPEELPEWRVDSLEPAAAVSLAASADAQAQAIERVIDQARRLASRGEHVVVVIDTLAGVSAGAARKALAAARRLLGGGSVTVIASGPEPLGGETTVIALDAALTAAGRFPAIDLAASWTMRPELLVGEAGAEAIARTRAEALGA